LTRPFAICKPSPAIDR